MYTDESGSFDIGLGYQVGGDRIRTLQDHSSLALCHLPNVNMFLVKVLIFFIFTKSNQPPTNHFDKQEVKYSVGS